MRRRPLEPEPGNAGGGNHGNQAASLRSCSRAAIRPTAATRSTRPAAADARDRRRLRARARARARRARSTSSSATSTRSIPRRSTPRSPTGAAVERHPADKDATDLELALDAARRPRRRPRSSWSAAPAAASTTSSPTCCCSPRPGSRDVARRGRGSATRTCHRRARPRRARTARPATCARCSRSAARPSACVTDGLRFPLRRRDARARDRPAASATSSSTPHAHASRSTDGVLLAVAPRLPKGRLMKRSPSRPRRARRRARRRRVAGAARGAAGGRHRRRSRSSPTTRSRCRSRCCAAFTKQTGIKVKVLQAGDAGAALNQAILTKDNPLGDVFFGVDNTFLAPRARRRRSSSRTTAPALDDGARRVPARRRRTGSRRSTTATCASTTTSSGSPKKKLAVPTTLDDLDQARVQGPARGREPGDVVARARVPARDHRALRRRRLARLLGASCAPTT